MQRLNAVDQCWTIVLLKNIWSDLDDVVGTDTYEVSVKSGMMELTERQAI